MATSIIAGIYRAGFDGTEITSFMGYLLANFNSPFTNQRTDEYGGSVKNRGRFMRELIDAIKQATPDHPLSVRLNGAELMDRWGGNTEDDSFELMRQAVDCGADMISVTVGWQEAPESSFGRDVQPGYWNYLSAKAKKMFPGVLVAFGNRLPDPAMADECIRDGVFDYWEVCRPLLADPELIHKAAEDRMEEVRPCIGSLNCLSRVFRDLPYSCTMNPALGHEVEIATDAAFTTVVASGRVEGTAFTPSAPLAMDTQHHVRVRAVNPCGAGAWSEPRSFRTVAPVCTTSALPIPDASAAGVTSSLVGRAGGVAHLAVRVEASHARVGDLAFVLRHVQLAAPRCLVLAGSVAAKGVLQARDGITRLRGRWHQVSLPDGQVLPALPTLHPAYLLRNPIAKREAWSDLLMLRRGLADSRGGKGGEIS